MRKFLAVLMGICLVLVALSSTAQAAPAICSESSKEDSASEVNKFFSKVQCTLEKAKPLVEEIEKEAKRLEESAKRFGESVINRLTNIMERLIATGNRPKIITIATSSPSSSTTTTTPIPNASADKETTDISIETNEIDDGSSEKCAENQVLDINRKCQPVL